MSSQTAGSSSTRREFGEGPLARAAALSYSLLAVELLFLLAVLPGLVPLVLLARDGSNVPLAALCAIPLGPALSAALYALRHHRGVLTDLRPAAAFWRGYRLNLGGVLRVWIPWLAWMTVVGVSLAHRATAGIPGWWAAVLVVLALVSALWMANALLITSLFAFRPIDVARLAAYFLGRTRGVTLGTLCLLIVAVGITLISSEAVLALLGSVSAAALLHTARPLTAAVTEEFTA
jgi:hypothetical protein